MYSTTAFIPAVASITGVPVSHWVWPKLAGLKVWGAAETLKGLERCTAKSAHIEHWLNQAFVYNEL